ncbi:site-specific integrase [Maridesulfovibrio frigidus]|uniref:hypothetical protein n=1 Tax=Maridesulfovibrio frigidus TaxID=340956 RepID=UPI0004E22EC2|nr:hypothetical protein [Maridesulfovibrio frigidus]
MVFENKILPFTKINELGVVRLKCEKDGCSYEYNLGFIGNPLWREEFARSFISLCARRKVHISRRSILSHLKVFMRYLEECQYDTSIPLHEISQQTIETYAVYLHRNYHNLHTCTALLASLLQLLKRLNALHDDNYFSFPIPNNYFTGTRACVEHAKAYSETQLSKVFEALKNRLSSNSILSFKEKWFDSNSYVVGTFRNKDFLDCYYVNYLGKKKDLDFIGISRNSANKKFYKQIRKRFGTVDNYRKLHPKEFLEEKFLGKKMVFVKISSKDIFEILLLAALTTGFNQQVLFDMRRSNWLTKHPFLKDVCLIQAPKFRSKKIYSSAFAEDNVDLIDVLKKYLRVSELLVVRDKQLDFFWVYNGHISNASFFGRTMCQRSNATFVADSGLSDTLKANALSFRRLRATSAEQMLVRFKGDFLKLQQFLNHSCSRTTYTYVENSLDNIHLQELLSANVEKMVCSFVSDDSNTVEEEIETHLQVDKNTTKDLLSGALDTPFAKCKNPYAGVCHGQEKGELCSNYDLLRCLICSNIVVFPTDLYKLFSYSYFKRTQLESGEITPEIFGFYEPLLSFIEEELVVRFNASDVEKMKKKAKEDPYYVHS